MTPAARHHALEPRLPGMLGRPAGVGEDALLGGHDRGLLGERECA